MPPSLNSSAVLTSAVNGNSSLNATSENKQYVFAPLGLDVTLTISVLIAVTSAVGFAGNLCVLRFTNNEDKKPLTAARCSNLNFFIRSLALSDVLGSLIGAPFALVQINSNFALVSEMHCKVFRYFPSLFIYITIFNLVIIGVERYICNCRPISRPISLETVRKAVLGAWISGFLAAFGFSYSFELIRIDLNSTHYTIRCEYNYKDPTSRLVRILLVLSTFVLPSIILIFSCACIARVLWTKEVNAAANTNSNESESGVRKWCQQRKKATTQLIVIIIAFLGPYLINFIIGALKLTFSSSMDVKTEYTSRAVGAVFVFLNSSVNFLIHLRQLNGFGRALKGYVVCREKDYPIKPVQNIRLGRIGKPKGTRPTRKVEDCGRRRASLPQVQGAEKSHETQTRRKSC